MSARSQRAVDWLAAQRERDTPVEADRLTADPDPARPPTAGLRPSPAVMSGATCMSMKHVSITMKLADRDVDFITGKKSCRDSLDEILRDLPVSSCVWLPAEVDILP